MLGDVEPSSAPPAEIHVDEALLRGLLRAQHPDLSELQLIAVGHGWDNTIFRLGDELALRLPRRKLAAPLIENEQRWLPVLARRLNLSVPEPVRVGVPGAGFPWAWSVVPWLDGQPSTLTGPSENYARPLAEFLSALHGPAPADAPENPFRGVPLSRIEARCEQRLQRLNQQGRLSLDLSPRLQALLRRTMAQASKADTPRTWIHGDLHPDNILVANQRLTAVIDWGDICAGDPATDLAAVWAVLPRAAHATFFRHYVTTAQTVLRAQLWCLHFALMWLETAESHAFAAMAKNSLQALAEAEGSC